MRETNATDLVVFINATAKGTKHEFDHLTGCILNSIVSNQGTVAILDECPAIMDVVVDVLH